MLFSNPIFVKIIVTILTFLSTLFPTNKNLIGMRQQYENNPDRCVPILIKAIEENDVETLESYMCKNIKDNTDNLPGEIRKLLDCIEGDIVTIEWGYSGGGTNMKQQDGRVISQVGFEINIKTTVDDYSIGFMWEEINNFQPEETGIRLMDLIKDYEPYEKLYNISATEGIMVWHE